MLPSRCQNDLLAFVLLVYDSMNKHNITSNKSIRNVTRYRDSKTAKRGETR